MTESGIKKAPPKRARHSASRTRQGIKPTSTPPRSAREVREARRAQIVHTLTYLKQERAKYHERVRKREYDVALKDGHIYRDVGGGFIERVTEKPLSPMPPGWIQIREDVWAGPPGSYEKVELDCSSGVCVLREAMEMPQGEHCGFCESVTPPLHEAVASNLTYAELSRTRKIWEAHPSNQHIPWRSG